MSSTVGPVVDASMEALIPELGKDALEASRGGLGILEGDCGEGYAEAGAKAFIITPMYEYKTVPKTDLINRRQILERVKVDYSNLTDYDNPLDYHSFIDSGNLTYPEFGKWDSTRLIKILADENGKQIKFTIFLFDEKINDFRGFDVAAFVVNRGGTPVFLAACQDIAIKGNNLYTLGQALF